VAFKPPEEDIAVELKKEQQLYLKQIEESVPPGYNVDETLDGRCVFWEEGADRPSWKHPDPDFQYKEVSCVLNPISVKQNSS
jgi:hypothetical protein